MRQATGSRYQVWAWALGLGLAVSSAVGAQPPSESDLPPESSESSGSADQSTRIPELEFRQTPIINVLDILSAKTGFSFIAYPRLDAQVTMILKNVDPWEAFELIIEANELAYERRGNIVTVMTADDYERLHGERFRPSATKTELVLLHYAKAEHVVGVLRNVLSKGAAVPGLPAGLGQLGEVNPDDASNSILLEDMSPAMLEQMKALIARLDRPLATRVYSLDYTEAEKLKDKLQGILSQDPMPSSFNMDARTNQVIISDTDEVLSKVDQIVKVLDVPDAQVLIESKIVKVELTDQMDLGIDWQRVFAGIDTSVKNNFDSVSGDVSAGGVTGSALKLLGKTGTDASVIIEALQKLTKTDTLSNPRIMVLNKQPANILVGTDEVVVTTTTTVPNVGATVTAPTIERVPVGTKLAVTPDIKRDGRIQLLIEPEISTAKVETFQSNRIPIVSKTQAKTTVLVKSGVTVIIGGLIETKRDRTDNQVPWLGQVPVLGLPFRGMNHTAKKTELVVFLKPQIILADGSVSVPNDTEPKIAQVSLSVTSNAGIPAAYRQMVREQLQQALAQQFRAAGLGQGSVIVSFVLNKDGELVGEQKITSPQGDAFVTVAHQGLQRASPFPPFPDGAQIPEVKFRIAVEYVPNLR